MDGNISFIKAYGKMKLWGVVIASLTIIATYYLNKQLWLIHPNVVHSAIEMACAVLLFIGFLLYLSTYKLERSFSSVVGSACLAAALFDLVHLYYFPGLKLFPNGYIDLSTRFWSVGSLVEALAILLGTRVLIRKAKTNLYLPQRHHLSVLIMMLSGAAFIAYLLIKSSNIPRLLTPVGMTPFYIAWCSLVILIFTAGMITYVREFPRPLQNVGLILGYVFAIVTQGLFIASDSIVSPVYLAGHLFKLVYYMSFLIGVTNLALLYPYRRMEQLNTTMEVILNHLPVGVTMYDSEQNIAFMNSRVRQLHTAVNSFSAAAKDPTFPNNYPEGINHDHFLQPLIYCQPDKNQPIKIFQHEQVGMPDGGMLHLYIDVSHEQEINHLRLQTQTILDSIPNPVLILNAQQQIISANPQFVTVLGYKPEPMEPLKSLAQRIDWLVIDEPSPDAQDIYGRSYSVSAISSYGKRLDLLITHSAINNMQDQLLGFVIVLQDVTEMKNQYEIIKQREKLAVLGQMAAGIVHEIKNPLTSIRGFSQILLDEDLPSHVQSYLTTMLESADDVNRVVTDFLAFARPRPPQPALISVNQLVDSVLYLLRGNSLMSGIQVQFSPCPDEKLLLADQQQIKQVLMNISKNAIEAASQVHQPAISYSTQLVNNEMQITITDNGPGIPQEEYHYLGTPFFTTKDHGTGLGLSICYQIIKEHHGRIEVQNNPGKGCAFIISIPCPPPAASTTAS